MEIQNKSTSLWGNIFRLDMPQIRTFHMTWFAFFLCFFAWFGIAPLMTVVRDELGMTRSQVGWAIIASVSMTVVARLVAGWLCDRIGPRRTYTWLLVVGSIPVMLIGLASGPWTFIFCRLLIGVIGASFVITQYHTSVMFAPNVVGTANATSAGWGNMGGGATQLVMPLLFAFFVSVMGVSAAVGWRASMFIAGMICALTGIAYFFLTQDAPDGNFRELRAAGKLPQRDSTQGTFLQACRDRRVWALFAIYGACFGIELTVNNVAALYFMDYFEDFRRMDTMKAVGMAGLIAGSFGVMNIFTRTLGGVFSDRFGRRWGLSGRVKWLFVVLFAEGLALMLFSQMNVLMLAIPTLILFSLFVQMSSGATFSLVPFVNRRGLGSVAGIVGAGGNAGAVAAGFLFKTEAISWPTALFLLGAVVTACSFLSFAVNFSETAEAEARSATHAANEIRRRTLELAAAGIHA
ncbi:MAG: MFS transporter [Planctomycetes bacterium]|nr:MFS transporter [Planctomycetota bacterium]